jgi:hypothetical protein
MSIDSPAEGTDEDDAEIVNMRFKYTRAQERNVIKYLVMRLWQQSISKTRDGDFEKYFDRGSAEHTDACCPEWTLMNYNETTQLWVEVVLE